MKSLNLLLIEDDIFDQMSVVRALQIKRPTWTITCASSLEEGRGSLARHIPDIVIADYQLVDGTAFDLIPTHAQQPIIVVTGVGDEAIAVKAINMGVADYLTKDADRHYLTVLPVLIESVLRRHRIETAEREQRAFAAALHDTAIALTSTLDLNEVLKRILVNVERVVAHDRACILLVENNKARIVQCSHSYPEKLRRAEYNIDTSEHLKQMMQTRETLVIRNLGGRHSASSTPGVHLAGAVLAAPIMVNNEVIGFICLENELTREFSLVSADRLRIFAAQAAVAIENAHLYQQSAELAALHERQNLARELHDSVTQTLFSAATVADAAIMLWRQDPHQIEQALSDLRNLTRGASAEMRTLLYELRPDIFAAASLRVLLQQLLDTLAGRSSIAIEFNAPRTPLVIPEDVKRALFRITQEALNNVVEHSRAKKVRLDVQHKSACIIVRITDDGRGFNPKIVNPSMGLGTMHAHARNAGIECTVTSAPGDGTVVLLQWTYTETSSVNKGT